MSTKALGIVAAFFGIDAALLLIVGAVMWNGSASRAEEAVGKALVTVGVALAIPAFCLVCTVLNGWAKAGLAQEAAQLAGQETETLP